MNDEKLDFKKILPIFVIVLIDLLGVTIILPLLPFYATAFGADPLVIGILSASYPLMQFIGAPLLGRLSDRYGRKPILIVSQIGTLIGFLVLGFAGALWMLFLSRIIDGLSGANISTAQAAIADSTTEKTRTRGLGLIGAAFGLGFIIGPIIAFAALALTNNDYRIPAFVAAGFSLVSILLTTFWFQETLDPAHRGAAQHKAGFSFDVLLRAVTHPVVGILLILVFAQQLAFGGFENFFSLFTLSRLGLNASENAAFFVWVGLILVAVQGGLVGQWSKRFGDRRVMLAGMGLLAVGLALSALTPMVPPPWYNPSNVAATLRYGTTESSIPLPPGDHNGWFGLIWMLLAQIPTAVGAGVLQPTLNSLITKRVSPAQVGGILGVSTSMLSAANVLAPLLAGVLFQFAGPAMPFWAAAVLTGALCLFAINALKPDLDENSPTTLASAKN